MRDRCTYTKNMKLYRIHCILTEGHAGRHVGHDTNNHGQLVTWNKKENEK